MESNKDRQYRTDHDRCWYTVALLAHRPIPERRNPSPPAPRRSRRGAGAAAPRSGSHILYRRRGNVAFLKCGYTIDARRVHLWLAVARYASSLAAVYASLYALPRMHTCTLRS